MFNKIKRYISHKRTQKRLKKLRQQGTLDSLKNSIIAAIEAQYGAQKVGATNEEEKQ